MKRRFRLTDKQPDSRKPARTFAQDKPWILALGVFFVVIVAIWLWMTPAGAWEKLKALGYAVCHQIEDRSFHFHDLQSPLCARCTGLYLGSLLSILFQVRQGRRGMFPPVWVTVALGLFFLWFGLDGLNSLLKFFPQFTYGYEPTNLLRLITGTGVGMGIGAVFAPLFNQTAWADWIRESYFQKWYSFPLLLLLAGLLVAGVYSQHPIILLPAMALSGLSVFFMLTALYSVLALFMLKRMNQQQNWQQMVLPLLLGANLAMIQIILTSLLRLLLTGTWGAIDL